MAVIILSHDVKDFEVWKSHYYADAARRESLSLNELAVGNVSDNPNKAYMIWEGDPVKVDQMLHDPELAEKMKAAGVVNAPEVVVLNT